MYDIRFYKTIDSTNTEALRLLNEVGELNSLDKKKELGGKTVFYARTQTAGRGQRGNKWHSVPGENLTFSLALRFGLDNVPSLKATDQYILNQIMALAVTDYLRTIGLEAMIKWPNDIYIGDKKICGILIENSLSGSLLKHSIIGIGLNLNQSIFDPSIPNPTSVFLETGLKTEAEKVLKKILDNIDARIASILKKEEVKEGYLSRLYRKGKVFSYIDELKGETIKGSIIGITDDFRLSIEIDDDFSENSEQKTMAESDGMVSDGMVSDRKVSDGMVSDRKVSDGKAIRHFAFKEIGYIII